MSRPRLVATTDLPPAEMTGRRRLQRAALALRTACAELEHRAPGMSPAGAAVAIDAAARLGVVLDLVECLMDASR